MAAARGGWHDGVRYLVGRGADINAVDHVSRRPRPAARRPAGASASDGTTPTAIPPPSAAERQERPDPRR